MPVRHKFLILAKIRCVDPFLHLDLAAACLFALMDLQKIFKSPIFIETSQREKPAKTRAEAVNTTAALLI